MSGLELEVNTRKSWENILKDIKSSTQANLKQVKEELKALHNIAERYVLERRDRLNASSAKLLRPKKILSPVRVEKYIAKSNLEFLDPEQTNVLRDQVNLEQMFSSSDFSFLPDYQDLVSDLLRINVFTAENTKILRDVYSKVSMNRDSALKAAALTFLEKNLKYLGLKEYKVESGVETDSLFVGKKADEVDVRLVIAEKNGFRTDFKGSVDDIVNFYDQVYTPEVILKKDAKRGFSLKNAHFKIKGKAFQAKAEDVKLLAAKKYIKVRDSDGNDLYRLSVRVKDSEEDAFKAFVAIMDEEKSIHWDGIGMFQIFYSDSFRQIYENIEIARSFLKQSYDIKVRPGKEDADKYPIINQYFPKRIENFDENDDKVLQAVANTGHSMHEKLMQDYVEGKEVHLTKELRHLMLNFFQCKGLTQNFGIEIAMQRNKDYKLYTGPLLGRQFYIGEKDKMRQDILQKHNLVAVYEELKPLFGSIFVQHEN